MVCDNCRFLSLAGNLITVKYCRVGTLVLDFPETIFDGGYLLE